MSTHDDSMADRFRAVFREWPAAVAVLAVRDDDRVYATTVTSFTPVAVDPPTVLVSLGSGAQVLPFLRPGSRVSLSLLARDQERVAQVFADSFPVGPSPFPASGDPVVPGAQAWITAEVDRVVEGPGGARVVFGIMLGGAVDPSRSPLLYRRRGYLGLGD